MMRNSFIHKALMLLCVVIVSCASNGEEEALKELMSKPIKSTTEIPQGKYNAKTLARLYMDQELAMNEVLIHKLELTAEHAFEKQLATFEDEELGFFQDFGNMFAYIVRSDESLKEEWKLKQGKYFSELSAKADYPNLTKAHAQDVNNLRKQFEKGLNSIVETNASTQPIHVDRVDLSGMVAHARNNVAFELVESILGKLGIAAIITSALALFIGQRAGGVIASILLFIFSIIASNWNDRRVISGIREQYHHRKVSYDDLRKSLNNQTMETYQPWLK